MAADPQNQQYGAGASLFGQDASAYASTGAGGSPGATEADTAPDTAYKTQATMPWQSVQNVPVPMVGVGVDDVNEAGQASEGISGLGPDAIASTGAGMGHVGGPGNPNSMNVPSLGEQLSAARRPS